MNDEDNVTGYMIAVETRMVRAVQHWMQVGSDGGADQTTASAEVGFLLEPFISQCIRTAAQPPTADWSSDGIVDLHLERLSWNRLCLRGVTWLISQRLVPFDLRLTLGPQQSVEFACTEFRIGSRDHRGRPITYTAGRPVPIPTKNSPDWLQAVELTPTSDG